MQLAFLIAISFLTSAWTAIIGTGGGIMLISILPGFVPAPALIPVHGFVQVASNSTRAAFSAPAIVWGIFWPFVTGAVIGAAVGSQVLVAVPWEYLPILLGTFILLITWLPRSRSGFNLPGKFFSVGLVQTFASLFLGAAGPLSPPFLLREGLSKDRLVATHAATMTVMHLLKILTFGLLGFAFRPYLPMIAGMVVGVTAGSYVGTRLRSRVPEALFLRLFRIVITLLALRLILRVAM